MLFLAGLGVTGLGLVPIALLILAIQTGGFLGGMLIVFALLLSPMLLFLRLGPFILMAVWKGQQVVVMGRQWGQATKPDPDVIDGTFQDE